MKNPFKLKYRIIKNGAGYFLVQLRAPFSPFWFTCSFEKTTIEDATKYAENLRNPVVKVLD